MTQVVIQAARVAMWAPLHAQQALYQTPQVATTNQPNKKLGFGRGCGRKPAQMQEALNHFIIRGIVSQLSSYTIILIERAAPHSFVSHEFTRALDLKIEPLLQPLTVTTPISGETILSDVCRDCTHTSIDFPRIDLIY